MSSSARNPFITELCWGEAKKLIHDPDPTLVEIIDAIDPGNTLKLVHASYGFGATIMHDDQLYLPVSKSEARPLSAFAHDDMVRSQLSYQSIPFGLGCKNGFEFYKEYEDKVFSVCTPGPSSGIELGIFEYIAPYNTHYSVSAGARSAFMLPKISEARNNKRLNKAYQLDCHPPKQALKHWHVFKKIAASPLFPSDWRCEMLFFTKNWHANLGKKSGPWQSFHNYILKKGCEHSELGRRKMILELNWQHIVDLIRKEGLKPDPYTIDTLKHLILVFLGIPTGMRPAVNNQLGPFSEIQEAYLNSYGIQQIPTIMQPTHFDPNTNAPVYYSMQSPIAIASTPNFRKMETVLEEMRELIVLKSFVLNSPKLTHEKLNENLKTLNLKFYHSDLFTQGGNIRPTYEIPQDDPDFLFLPDQKYSHYKFAENGSFVKGCIAITKTKDAS